MSDRQISPVTARLLKAREFLSDPNKHCKYTLLGADGRRCVRGAIMLDIEYNPRASDELHECDRLLHKAAIELYMDILVVSHTFHHVQVNNELGYEPIMKVLDRAITFSMEKVSA
jgi:hypothetical protein